jgi:hypothetical protein
MDTSHKAGYERKNKERRISDPILSHIWEICSSDFQECAARPGSGLQLSLSGVDNQGGLRYSF